MRPQIKGLWREIGNTQGPPWPRGPWEEKATEAVLRFLRGTRVGCISTRRKPPEEECVGQGEGGEEGESEEGRP